MAHALIIDDNTLNVQVMENLLNKQHVTHSRLLDPTQLSTVLASIDHLDIVFLDLEMPELNGFDVLKMFKANERFANVPIVACTVHVAEVISAHNAGFHSFISKPLDAQRFPKQLEQILQGKRIWERV